MVLLLVSTEFFLHSTGMAVGSPLTHPAAVIYPFPSPRLGSHFFPKTLFPTLADLWHFTLFPICYPAVRLLICLCFVSRVVVIVPCIFHSYLLNSMVSS